MANERKRRMQPTPATGIIRCHLAQLMEQKSARDGRKLTKHRLHVETGIAPGTISEYYDGQRGQYDARVVSILCAYFGCTVGDLLEYVGDTSGQQD